jgi:rhodanese-related sulfurtransferase
MITKLAPNDLQASTQYSRDAQWIDVRSPSEFAACHVPGATNIPLEQLESRLADMSRDRSVVLICQGGQRAGMAAKLLERHCPNLTVLEGGTNAWISAGLPVVTSTTTRWSLERQVRLGAGLLVLLGVALSFAVSTYWILLSGFVGLGLTFAGLTDICPMGILLAGMPWNRPARSSPEAMAGDHACSR